MIQDAGVKSSRQALAVSTAVGVLVAAALWMFNPAEAGFFWRCPFNALTGWYCPGCGGQRALHLLLHGRFLEALHLNALAVLVFAPVAAYAYLGVVLRALDVAELPVPSITPRHLTAFFFVVAAYGILRNLPWGPLTLLAP
jgi:hypothetical protein